MSAVTEAARARRLTLDPDVVTALGAPVLRGWKRLDEYVDPKLVGTDPAGQAWIIERVEASDGPAWLVWAGADWGTGRFDAEPAWNATRALAIDYASNMAARAARRPQ